MAYPPLPILVEQQLVGPLGLPMDLYKENEKWEEWKVKYMNSLEDSWWQVILLS